MRIRVKLFLYPSNFLKLVFSLVSSNISSDLKLKTVEVILKRVINLKARAKYISM